MAKYENFKFDPPITKDYRMISERLLGFIEGVIYSHFDENVRLALALESLKKQLGLVEEIKNEKN